MPKRKKYPKLPNGFGSIRYLGKGRRNPYGVYPPATEQYSNGAYVTPKALCYVSDYMTGIRVLTLYGEGKYHRGDPVPAEVKTADDLIAASMQNKKGITFAEVFEKMYYQKFDDPNAREYSRSARQAMKSAYKNCESLHNRPFKGVVHDDMQSIIDNLPLKHSSKENLVSLFKQMSEYAVVYHITDRNESIALKIKTPEDEVHGTPFSDEDLIILWGNKDDPVVRMILVMCYSGFRISAFKTLEVNMKERYFKGGVKTKAGKGRIVPIHSAIYRLIEPHMTTKDDWWLNAPASFRRYFNEALRSLGIERHRPHDTRHTFSRLCEKYGVSERDQKRMLGHSFSDVTNAVYGHRDLEDLRKEIEKIKV